MTRVLTLALCTVAVLLASTQAGSAQTATITTDHIKADLTVRNAATKPGETTDIAIHHTLAKGWHTYWINPGDSGEPPIVEWDLKGGGEAGEIHFPAPIRLPYPPLLNFGYKDNFTLLTSLTVPADWPEGVPYRAPVRIDWLVCEAICIPEGGTAELVIPTGGATTPDSAVAFTFVKAERAIPAQSDAPASYSRDGTMLYLSVPLPGGADTVFFPLERGVIDNAAPQTAIEAADGAGLAVTLAAGNANLDGTLRGVLKTDGRAVFITARGDPDAPLGVEASSPSAPSSLFGNDIGTGTQRDTGADLGSAAPTSTIVPSADRFGAGQLLLFAFLGGLILNLMPCVFPVLALKVLGLITHADAPLGRRAVIGAAYTSGILTSFAILAAVLLTLKAAGVAVGWGFQLQSPVFVAAMAGLIFAVGLNLSGIFELGASLTRLGGRGPQDGVAGSFATGCLATVVATPCTAPFMALAMGAAFAASNAMALGVFAAMGLGLAAPFVLLTLLPGLALVMPKPGVWMARLKEVLAFPLYATTAWLLWVLAQLVGIESLFGALLALVLVGFAAWLYGLSQRGSGRSHKFAASVSALSIVAALFAAWPTVTGAPRSPAIAATAGNAVAFSPDRLAELLAERAPILLNVTAAWCITCKVNERVVFQSDEFQDLLADNNITFMTADWTRRDPDITALIEGFGRAGVPLYVHYPVDGPAEVLPQFLTLAGLKETFEQN